MRNEIFLSATSAFICENLREICENLREIVNQYIYSMQRRDFLKNISLATLPAFLGGFTIKAFGANQMLAALSGANTETDHVLVLIQLIGGNDGLNMVIPLDQYSALSNARANILIPDTQVLGLTGTNLTGLHPAMTGMRDLYDAGKLHIVQSVGYPNQDYSHFRSTDIWLTGADTNQSLDTGWLGRYLGYEYPNFPVGYPNATMPDPIALQIGSVISPSLIGVNGVMGMAINSTSDFYNAVNGTVDPAPATKAGKELTFLRQVAQQTDVYVNTIVAAASTVTQQAPYPAGNTLAAQLKIVANLIAGGLKTRIYMVSSSGLGSFDTHDDQVVAGDTTTGKHAGLLASVSDAIKAFTDDLAFLGVEDRVIGATFSEFGRRIQSNGSVGTDHGAAAPMFIFGKEVQGGILGTNPVIPATITSNDNIPFQYDFRSIYATLLQDWFCVPNADLNSILLNNFQTLPLLNNTCAGVGIHELNQTAGETLIKNYPNPFGDTTTISFRTQGGHTAIQIFNYEGKVIQVLVNEVYAPGDYTISWNSTGLAAGNYYARLQNGSIQQVRSMMKIA